MGQSTAAWRIQHRNTDQRVPERGAHQLYHTRYADPGTGQLQQSAAQSEGTARDLCSGGRYSFHTDHGDRSGSARSKNTHERSGRPAGITFYAGRLQGRYGVSGPTGDSSILLGDPMRAYFSSVLYGRFQGSGQLESCGDHREWRTNGPENTPDQGSRTGPARTGSWTSTS